MIVCQIRELSSQASLGTEHSLQYKAFELAHGRGNLKLASYVNGGSTHGPVNDRHTRCAPSKCSCLCNFEIDFLGCLMRVYFVERERVQLGNRCIRGTGDIHTLPY